MAMKPKKSMDKKAPRMYTAADDDQEQLTGSDEGAMQSYDPMEASVGDEPEEPGEHMELPKSARLRHRGMPAMKKLNIGKSR